MSVAPSRPESSRMITARTRVPATSRSFALFTFVCGWLQGYFGWTPAEADLNPPPPMALHPHEHH